MTSQKIWAFLWFPLLLFYSCEKWDLEQRDFLEVEITGLEVFSIDSVRISGLIKGLVVGPVQDHGFLWTSQQTPPSIFYKEGVRSLGIRTIADENVFTDSLNLTPNTAYLVRAYATLDGENYVYSDEQSFRTGTGSVSTLELRYEGGRSLEASGLLYGTEKGVVATQHGFCWSAVHTEPGLADQAINLGLRITDEVFTATIGDLQENRTTYIRAYAVISLDFKIDTVFGEVLAFDGNLNYWARRADLGGGPRSRAVGFSIGGKGYVGLGVGGGSKAEMDFWAYDPQTDSWTQKADFGGTPSADPVAFSIGERGYVYAAPGEANYGRQFWEYDPGADRWTQKADFGGQGRNAAVGFSIGGKGYVGLGWTGDAVAKDFWEYDPQTDRWTQKADFGGEGRRAAAAFSVGGKGYVCAGIIMDGSYQNDLWEYDPQSGSWSRKADFTGEAISYPAGFSIGALGYVGTGAPPGKPELREDFWAYDPEKDLWSRRADFGGGPRMGAVGFAIGAKGYVGAGENENRLFTADFWEFDP